MSLYGLDVMLQISLFYLVWMDSRTDGPPRTQSGIPTRLLQLHLCLIYLDTGIVKASGVQWWNGEALWRALMQPQFAVFDVAFLAQVPRLMMVATISVLLLELSYPMLVWVPRARTPMLVAIIALHLGIALSMGLVLFAATMIVLNLTAFAPIRTPDSDAGPERAEPATA